jgi:phosphopantothenoylcysteine decarboxylase/phosphopantothenate--cysteine ligase
MTVSTPPNTNSDLRLLITAGPTYERIDAVRFLGNRSSGKLGVALAEEAARRGWTTTLLLGPNAMKPEGDVRTLDFESTADLEGLLEQELPDHDALVMAAAVSDYRPAPGEVSPHGKRRRTGDSMHLTLESTPDLLAGCSRQRSPDQLLVGFALEPVGELRVSGLRKLERKGIDLVVANPLETMGSDTIDATVLASTEMIGVGLPAEQSPPSGISKAAFASWLLDAVERAHTARTSLETART